MNFDVRETDPVSDDTGTVYTSLYPNPEGYEGYYSERVVGTAKLSDAWFVGCGVIYGYSKEMELLVPLPTSDRAVFTEEILG